MLGKPAAFGRTPGLRATILEMPIFARAMLRVATLQWQPWYFPY
jgi:hypothetical protein